jgi:hypothetical protein
MRTVLIQVEEVKVETDLAFLFVIDGDEVWVPKSVIDEPDDIEVRDEEIEIEIHEWWASREGLV